MLDSDQNGFLDYFGTVEDHRVDRKKLYPVAEIMLLVLTAVVSGCDGWRDIENFGHEKISFLRNILPFVNGTPSDDTLRRFFRRLDPQKFQEQFAKWVVAFRGTQNNLIAIDGKVSRHTFDTNQSPIHTVSAFASESRLVLAQTKVSGKSNEITAIPELLKMIDLKDSVVTIDAMGCQRDIAQNITESGADYVLALKGNQGNLQKSVKILFAQEQSLKELSPSIHTQNNRGHGRSETRTCTVINAPELLQKSTKWPGLKTLVEINSTRILKNKTESEKRYYVSSLQADAEQMLHTIRSHWSIENQLHYILDVSFQDDASRIRKGNAPMNMGIVKHMALNLIRVNQGKRESIKGLRKIAGWSNQRLSQIVFGVDAAKSQDE